MEDPTFIWPLQAVVKLYSGLMTRSENLIPSGVSMIEALLMANLSDWHPMRAIVCQVVLFF
jgi:hypothetical protein